MTNIPVEDRFWAKVQPTGFCWEWTGATNGHGYGRFTVGQATVYAHRFAYESLIGGIGVDLTIDHLCRNSLCVNPDHMEPVPMSENLRRSFGVANRHRNVTHCPRGHAYAGENLYVSPDGRRACQACKRASRARYRQRAVSSTSASA